MLRFKCLVGKDKYSFRELVFKMVLSYVSGCKQGDDELEPPKIVVDFPKHLKFNPL